MKKIIKPTVVILIILLVLFLSKDVINHQYNLWYIKKFGVEYNNERKRLGYELLPSNWIRSFEYDKKHKGYFICWESNLNDCKEYETPSYYSKCQTFYSYGLFNCHLYLEVDGYQKNTNKLGCIGIYHSHGLEEGINEYYFSYEIKDTNVLNALEPVDIYNVRDLTYLKKGKDMIEFPLVENVDICKEKYDSILISWGIISPRLIFAE
jgi:hypothetical protein